MRLKTLLRNNGLSIALLLLFAFSIAGQCTVGHKHLNETRREHGQPPVSFTEYLRSGNFVEATFENWESEFLQMALYVWLTSFLFQRGSAESKDPDKQEDVDEDPRLHANDPDVPKSVRRGGLRLWVYERSLLLAMVALFMVSFALHLWGSTRNECEEQMLHGGPCPTVSEQLLSSTFWYESLENWQSEFLSIAALVVLSIVLRQKGSPESKPVHAAHSHTGK
jgi:hypothetical protein